MERSGLRMGPPSAKNVPLHRHLFAQSLLVLLLAIPTTVAAWDQTAVTVALLGDSITSGTVSDDDIVFGLPYADLVASLLGENYHVTNIGCGGAMVSDWLPFGERGFCDTGSLLVSPDPNFYQGRALPLLPADVVTILLGTNDAIGFELGAPVPVPVPLEEYLENLDELITALLADGARNVILMTAPHAFGSDGDSQVRLASYALALPDLCDGASVHCGPDLYELLEPEHFGTNGFGETDIHPNAAGHAEIAEALVDSITIVVPEPGQGVLAFVTLASLTVLRQLRSSTFHRVATQDSVLDQAPGQGAADLRHGMEPRGYQGMGS